MTAKIIQFTGITKLDLHPDVILEGAKGTLEGCVVLGFTPEGDFYGASSYADGGAVIWLLEVCKHLLITGSEQDD